MKGPCIQAVRSAIGRDITQAESRNIENRIREHMRMLAKEDPKSWQELSAAQRLTAAAESASNEIIHEATQKKIRIALTIATHDKIENYTKSQVDEGLDNTRLDAFSRMLVGKHDGKNNTQSLDSQIKGTFALGMQDLVNAFDTIHPIFLGLFRNKESETAMLMAMSGDKSVPHKFIEAAKAWKEVTDKFRERANAAGSDIGKREDWGKPQSHNDRLFLKRPKEEVIADYFRWIKKDEYVHEDGRPYSDHEILHMLDHPAEGKDPGGFYQTVVTDGWNKPVKTDIPGGNIKANRHTKERVIHFKDAQSAVEQFNKYGDKNLFQVMVDHIHNMSRDIALIETFGPNADLTVKHFVETLARESVIKDAKNKNSVEKNARGIINLYNHIAGNTESPNSMVIAMIGQGMRDWLSGVMLGSVPISSIPDYGTIGTTGKLNQIPAINLWMNQLRSLNPAIRSDRQHMQSAGLMVEHMIDDVNRFAVESMGPRMTARISNLLYRLTLQSRWDSNKYGSFRTALLNRIGETVKENKSLSSLGKDDYQNLIQSGVTDADYSIWRMAKPEKWRGNDTVLTARSILEIPDSTITNKFPDINPSIAKEKAITKLLGFTYEQSDIAIPKATMRERAKLEGGTNAGTISGQLIRSAAMFRSFPFAFFDKHIAEASGRFETKAGKIGYIASLIAMQTMLGAIAIEIGDLISGRNPRALAGGDHLTRNWLSALAKGGGLGAYGDFLFNDASTGGHGLADQILGPTGAILGDLDTLTRGNILKSLRVDKTKAGAESVMFAKNYLIPGSRLWYAKAALNHMVLDRMQEHFSPGYLSRAQSHSRNLYGTSYWWRPGTPFSQAETPDLGTMVKEK